MDKSSKKIFPCLALLDLGILSSEFEVVVAGEGVWKITPEPKMQEISWNG